MTNDSHKHHRHTPRLKDYDYSSDGAYFMTLCTHNRECIFGHIIDGEMLPNEYGKIVRDEWHNLPNRYLNIGLDAIVVMPNHIHAIIVIHDVGAIHELPLRNDMAHRRRMLIPTIIGYVKMKTAKRINQCRNTTGIHVWQRNYHEHVIRDEDDLYRVREYINNNPFQWDMDSENPENIGTRR
jgi:REP element-mobilizing transposase RayT